MGIVYLIQEHNDSEYLYKIGFTKNNAEKRLKELVTGNPNNMKVIEQFKTNHDFTLERTLHRFFRCEKVKNEWFRLSLEQVKSFKSTCEKLEKQFDFLKKENTFIN